MRITGQRHTFIAVCSKISLEQRCNATWRRAGAPIGRQQARGLYLVDLSHELTTAIHSACNGDLDGQAALYIIEPGPQFHLGPLSDHELDALGGAVPIARNGGVIATAVSAHGARVLVRLCSDGTLETIAFCRPRNESGFVQVGDIRASTTMFVTYRKFEDLVCGMKDTGTRVLDVARHSCWNSVVEQLQAGQHEAALADFQSWFARDINPRFPVPYPLSAYEAPTANHTLPAEAEMILRAILVLVAPCGPASIQVRFPATPIGRARIVEDSLQGDAGLPHALKRSIEALGGLVVFDADGSGEFIPKDVDLHPLRAHTLNDIAMAHVIDIEHRTRASAHEIIETRGQLAAYWDRASRHSDLAARLQIVGRGLAPNTFIESIDGWIRS